MCVAELAAIEITEVRQLLTSGLPPGRGALGTVMSPDVYVLHHLAFTAGLVCQWIQIFKRGPDIISVVNSERWEITRDPPVARLLCHNPHSAPADSVSFPVWCTLIRKFSR